MSVGVPIPAEPPAGDVVWICEKVCAFMRSKDFTPSRKEAFQNIMGDRIRASDAMF